jgi:hypothetical protein
MNPRQTGLAPSFLFESLRFFGGRRLVNYCGLVSSYALAIGPTSTAPSQHNERVRCSADYYLEELKAEASCVRGASPGKVFES